jgi:hypothetical protein
VKFEELIEKIRGLLPNRKLHLPLHGRTYDVTGAKMVADRTKSCTFTQILFDFAKLTLDKNISSPPTTPIDWQNNKISAE